jgi:hypothetical protein
MITMLYVWPLLFGIHIFVEGLHSATFNLVLLGCWVATSLACWAIASWEQQHWVQRRSEDTLSHWADPPPWQ